ncbi:MAG: cytochrome c [Planctomycetes bacterium]|nr:cytochrome c [Planctomycetota bacterium]
MMRQFRTRQWSILLPLALISALISCGKTQTPAVPANPSMELKNPGEQTSAIDPVEIDRPSLGDKGPGPSSLNPTPNQDPDPAEVGEPDSSDTEAAPVSLLLSEPEFERRAKLGHLVAKRRCILCHKVDGRGAILQPPLIQVSARRLERMKGISEHLDLLQADDPDRYQARVDLFNSIEAEPDLLRKMSIWLHGYLKQPTFDNAQAKMPLQVLKPEEIDQLASYVIQLAVEGVKQGVPTPE